MFESLFQFKENVVMITLDSLRYDVAAEQLADGRTPGLARVVKSWEPRDTHATYTLPAHVSFFAGLLPRRRGVDASTLESEQRLFALSTSWNRFKGRNIKFWFDDAENIVKGFESKGYETIGVGGVSWFDIRYKSASLWLTMFQTFVHRPEYSQENPQCFENQIHALREILQKSDPKKLKFIFLNIAATHHPYMGFGLSKDGQKKALEYVDGLFPELLSLLPRPLFGIICADHGDACGEDEKWGHAFIHPKVIEVPYAEFSLPR